MPRSATLTRHAGIAFFGFSLALLAAVPTTFAAPPPPERFDLIGPVTGAPTFPGVSDGIGPVQPFEVNRAGVAALRKAGRGRVTFPLPGHGNVELTLEHGEILAPNATVTLSDVGGVSRIPVDLTIFRGRIEGDPGAWAVIGLSRDTIFGSITTSEAAWAILPPGVAGPDGGRHRILNESELPAPLRDLRCGMEDDPSRWPEASRKPGPDGSPSGGPATRLVCNMAVDGDYDFLATFAGNVTLATNYTLTMMATVSAIYERDIDVTLSISYLNFWGNPSDPYDQADAGNQLSQLRTYWNTNLTGVGRDLVTLISGRTYGGVAGIAYLGVLCSDFGYSLVSIPQATETYPTNQVNFNASLMAHELGHNFGSPHTHSCFWQSAGYLPAGALIDSCNAAEGACYNGPIHTAFGKGTIMSYCHLLGPPNATLRLDFHPHCISVMRAESEAACLQPAPTQPPTDLEIVEGMNGPTLSWTPSTTPGVIRYEVYASVYTLDWNPGFLDTTASTTFEPLPTGTYYFKVKAVTESDTSPFSSEVRASACAYTEINSPVTLPLASVSADFDEDGIPDLALVAQNPKVVAVMRGQGTAGVGNGTFAAPVTYAAGPAPTNLAVGDFNEDGRLDLAVTSYNATAGANGTLQILLGQGTGTVGNGTFAPAIVVNGYRDPTHLVTGDFNEDGITDIATGGGFPGRVAVFLGQGSDGIGTGSFNAPTLNLFLSNRPTCLATGDFNADGITDLAASYRGPSSDNEARVVVLTGQGTGGKGNGLFVENPIYAITASLSVNVTDLLVTDFNADGILDLAVASDTLTVDGLVPRIGISLGLGDGTFGFGRSWQVGGTSLLSLDLGDMNQDGIADIVATNNETGESESVALLYGGGSSGVANGGLGVPLRFGTGGPDGKKVLVGDYDEDEIPDVALSLLDRVAMQKSLCAVAASDGIELVSPVGGEAWVPVENRTIEWTKGVGVMTVDIQVSRDGGAIWETIAQNIVGTSYNWTVTPPATINARVRVLDSTIPNRNDASTSDFYIGATSAVNETVLPDAGFSLAGAHPNPFRNSIAFRLHVPTPGSVDLTIVDVQGRRVRGTSEVVGSAGSIDMTWDGRSDNGEQLPSGVYYARITHAGKHTVRTITLVR
jgi:hypothetical protein